MYRTTNRPNTRIEVADALRGIAVAGIILFHAREHFNLYWSALDLPRAGFGSWEQPVADALGFLLSGKMYAIFALLFGLSFFIQSDNQAQRATTFRGASHGAWCCCSASGWSTRRSTTATC